MSWTPQPRAISPILYREERKANTSSFPPSEIGPIPACPKSGMRRSAWPNLCAVDPYLSEAPSRADLLPGSRSKRAAEIFMLESESGKERRMKKSLSAEVQIGFAPRDASSSAVSQEMRKPGLILTKGA